MALKDFLDKTLNKAFGWVMKPIWIQKEIKAEVKKGEFKQTTWKDFRD